MLGVLDDRAIEHLLQAEVIARIACYADERLYVVPVTYVVASETSRPSREMMPSTHGRQVKGQEPIVYRIPLTGKTGRYERLPWGLR